MAVGAARLALTREDLNAVRPLIGHQDVAGPVFDGVDRDTFVVFDEAGLPI